MYTDCTRKGASEAIQFLGELARKSVKHFTLDYSIEYFERTGLLNIWDLDSNAKDRHGLKRALGDLFGKHGFGLDTFVKDGLKYYIVPGSTMVADPQRCTSNPEFFLYLIKYTTEVDGVKHSGSMRIAAGSDAMVAVEVARTKATGKFVVFRLTSVEIVDRIDAIVG